MKRVIVCLVIILLITGIFIAGCQTGYEEKKVTMTFKQLLDDYVIDFEKDEMYFKSYNIGDTIYIKDTVADVFVVSNYQDHPSNKGTVVYFESAGTGNLTEFGPWGLGFEGDYSLIYSVGKKVTVKVIIVGTSKTDETLNELLLFSILFFLPEQGDNGKETLPTAIFLTRNHSDTLYDNEQDDDVATITLVEGTLKLTDVRIMISSDGDTYYNFTDFSPIPMGDQAKWESGEAVIVNETNTPTEMLDENGNWASTYFYVRIIYTPADELIYFDHVYLEESTLSG